MKILAIETSCDETAAAVIEVNRSPITGNQNSSVNREPLSVNVLSNVVASQIDIHKKYGGVFPELASRAHTEKIIPVVEEALKSSLEIRNEKLGAPHFPSHISNIDYLAVTTGPGLIGSLLIGVNFAKTLAFASKKPIIGINHLLGHIYSNFVGKYQISNIKYQNEKPNNLHLPFPISNVPTFPALILIVSGGHTGLYLMKSHTSIRCLGETLDDAAGEAFDKVAKLLGLEYPGGPAIAAEAEKILNSKPETLNKSKISKSKTVIPAKAGIQKFGSQIDFGMTDYNLPRPMIDSKDYNFSFSGLKTAVLYKVKELSKTSALSSKLRAAMAAEFQQAVIDILVSKTIQAANEFRPKSICLCGGVSANKELRDQMQQAVRKFSKFSQISLSSQTGWDPDLGSRSGSRLPGRDDTDVTFHVPSLDLTGDNAAMIGIAAAYHISKATKWNNIHADANLKL